jgi:hypothetical protein
MRFLSKTIAIAALGLVAVTVSAVALAGSASVSVSSPIDVTNDVYANNEESLGMDPSGTLLAGAWNDWEYNDGCGFSYSTDGGDTWAPESFVPGLTNFTNSVDVAPLVPSKFAIAGDPSVAWNPKSHKFDVICQAFGSKSGNQIQLLSTAFDPAVANPNADVNVSYGRAAWRLPATPVSTGKSNGSEKGSNGKFPDHEAITVDTGTGPGHHFGRLYVAWAEFSGSGRSPIDVAYSDDDGATWAGPIRISDSSHQSDQDAHPTVGPNGALYVTWVNGPNEKSLKNNQVMIAKSTDGGANWGANQVVAPIVSPTSGLLPNSDYRVFADAGAAVDQQSGLVVVVYNDQATGASQMYSTHNLAAGDLTHWSAPKRVKPGGQEQFFPWVSAAPNGRVDLVYYDRSCDPAGDKLNCVTLSSTQTSGDTWSSVSLLSQGFDGDTYSACLAFGDPLACGIKFLGDYIAVASTGAKAQALWTGNGPNGMDVFSGRAVFGP